MALGREWEEPAEAFCSTLASVGDSAALGSCVGGQGAEVPLEALWALTATIKPVSSVRLVAALEPVCIHECCGKCWCTGQVLGKLELPYMPLDTGKMFLPWAGVVGALCSALFALASAENSVALCSCAPGCFWKNLQHWPGLGSPLSPSACPWPL